MDRRAFLGTLAGGMLAAPLALEAQQAGKLPRLGILQVGSREASITVRNIESFRQGLLEHGYVEGKNVLIEWRYEDTGPWPALAKDLVDIRVDLIVATGTPAALAAKQATSAIPIVAVNMADPVADGLVASLARPGGNVTGITFLAPELGAKRLELLKDLIPGLTHVAVLQHPGVYSERTMQGMLTDLDSAARTLGIHLQVVAARQPDDFDNVFSDISGTHANALILFSSPMFYVNYRRLVALAARYRVPTMYYFVEAVQAGGLICYGASLQNVFHRSAVYVDKLLKGAKPSDLPVEQPIKYDLAVNLKTAKALGLSIPQSLLLRADEVIQ